MELSFILIGCIIFKLRGSKSTIEKQMMQSDYFFFSPKRKNNKQLWPMKQNLPLQAGQGTNVHLKKILGLCDMIFKRNLLES